MLRKRNSFLSKSTLGLYTLGILFSKKQNKNFRPLATVHNKMSGQKECNNHCSREYQRILLVINPMNICIYSLKKHKDK